MKKTDTFSYKKSIGKFGAQLSRYSQRNSRFRVVLESSGLYAQFRRFELEIWWPEVSKYRGEV